MRPVLVVGDLATDVVAVLEGEPAPGSDRPAAIRTRGGGAAGARGQVSAEPFVGPIGDFYLTNPVARASGVMAECSALARGARLEAAE